MRALVFLPFILMLACATHQPGSNLVNPIRFRKEIIVSDQKISVDGRYKPVQCQPMPSDSSGFTPFATLIDGEGRHLNLICIDDYLGGIAIMNSQGKNLFYLAQSDGDAGEMWESRSRITHTNGVLKIEKVTVSSYPKDEDELGGEVNCKLQESTYVWRDGSFIESNEATRYKVGAFSPPIHVSKQCLSSQGQWMR